MARTKNETWEWIKALAAALLLAGIIRFFLFAPVVVDGQSMMPTLHDGDRLIVNKFSYVIGEPKRFDIVVFHATEQKDYIKRVIGLPGDTIEYKDDTLYVNGKKVKEEYLEAYKKKTKDGNFTYDFTLLEVTAKQKVPEGQLFVLGDNRRNSSDSRNIGTVDEEHVLGKASFRFWPLKDIGFVE
ncbi:signal peptidase I [Fictibacillus barbaricus]|uniref:Signal peptidase I n=1 Tax=Fictibacillus barbaricus TaxID=182136 RepID=A0ABS2ZCE0_9BACL|nr:signal peptidase I [Fictibacillus barbaricus]MBN3545868.1 signal peptidase I [Fictibacillus barbaricus]GGB56752.1 signal peptidase I [Fictibacillus barbaricus]